MSANIINSIYLWHGRQYVLVNLYMAWSPMFIMSVLTFSHEMFQKSKVPLSCLNKPFPKGVYPLYLPYPLSTSFPGHPQVFLDSPFSFPCQLGIARPNQYWCLTRYPFWLTSSSHSLQVLTTINFLNCTQNFIFIKHILNYSIYKILRSYFWLWALTFFSFHLNILYFWISILKPILWFLVFVLGKIFPLTHFILAFLARLIFKPWHLFYALEYLVRYFLWLPSSSHLLHV